MDENKYREYAINTISQAKSGLFVVCGPMFAGKSSFLLSLNKKINNKIIIKHSFDDRYKSKNSIVTHDADKTKCCVCKNTEEIRSLLKDKEKKKELRFVLIDEVQFFDKDIVQYCVDLVNQGKVVVCFGLDKDFNDNGFEITKDLMSQADNIYKIKGTCFFCGNPSVSSFLKPTITERKNGNVIIGTDDKYIPLCRGCFSVFNILKKLKTNGTEKTKNQKKDK